MAVLYTPKQINAALRALRIKPKDGLVIGREAAQILSWRALHEQGIDHVYRVSALRKHVQKGNLRAYPLTQRMSQYKVEDIFDLPLVPRRGAKKEEMPL